MSKQGFIKLYRQVQDHWIFQEKRKFSKFEAWVDMIMTANHKDNKFLLGNELVEVERGQFITSIRKLGDRWGWSNTKVSQFLDLLKSDEMIDYKKDTKKTVVTIVKYSDYHDSENTKKTANEHEKDTNRTQKHTNKNVKNVKNDKNKERSKLKFETHHFKLAELLFKEIRKNNESAKEPNLEDWANTFRLMMERDKRAGKDIQDVILFCQNHEFWYMNILSANKLRKQFDRLHMEMNKTNRNKPQKNNRKVADF